MSLETEIHCGCAIHSIDELLKGTIGAVPIEKAIDPLNKAGFLKIIASLSRAMSRATEKTETEILRKSLNNLDVDWPRLTEKQRGKIIEAAASVVGNASKKVIGPVQQSFSVYGPRIVTGSKKGERKKLAAKFSSRINVSFESKDKRVIDHATTSQALFIRDEYGRRRDAFSRNARGIVAEALEEGLGREEITEALYQSLSVEKGIARSRSYWTTIAATFANRSRTYGQLASYEEAGIERYVFEAILDEVTTDQCAALHGRTFEVQNGLDLYRKVAESEPESVKDIQPWIRIGKGPDGKRIMFAEIGGKKQFVAEIVQSRVGSKDTQPGLRNMRSNDQLVEMGLVMPPLHGRCRSTIVADV